MPICPPLLQSEPAMSAKCHECNTEIAEPESTQVLPTENGVSAHVSIYRCGCGHVFTTVEYEAKSPHSLRASPASREETP